MIYRFSRVFPILARHLSQIPCVYFLSSFLSGISDRKRFKSLPRMKFTEQFGSPIVVRTSRSLAVSLRKEGQVELLGRRPTDLSRVQACRKSQHSVNTKM